MSSPQVWFITGASSGFGYGLACHVLDQGDIVIATMRNPNISGEQLKLKYPSNDNLLVLKLDVTNVWAISDAFKAGREKYGRIDVVFNNAGMAILCELEGTPEFMARELFDVNFWGATNMTKEAVKCFRENNPPGGRLIQNSSSAASTCNAGVSYYGASKAALESITEALSQEVDPHWNIKITILELGPYNTPVFSGNMRVLPPTPNPPYSDPITAPKLGANPFRLSMTSGEIYKVAADPEKAVKVFYKIGGMEDPPFRLMLHTAALKRAQTRIDSLQKGMEGFEQWRDEIFGEDNDGGEWSVV